MAMSLMKSFNIQHRSSAITLILAAIFLTASTAFYFFRNELGAGNNVVVDLKYFSIISGIFFVCLAFRDRRASIEGKENALASNNAHPIKKHRLLVVGLYFTVFGINWSAVTISIFSQEFLGTLSGILLSVGISCAASTLGIALIFIYIARRYVFLI